MRENEKQSIKKKKRHVETGELGEQVPRVLPGDYVTVRKNKMRQFLPLIMSLHQFSVIM